MDWIVQIVMGGMRAYTALIQASEDWQVASEIQVCLDFVGVFLVEFLSTS